ncbi:MAG TPA: FlgD immunoglobulin-like domain containing protein, partial [Candidatus Eisenbacteria bacterium]
GDYFYDATSLTVDWMRMTPYVTTGTFTSRVFDALASTDWGVASWSADLPAGASAAMSVRQGSATPPDASWSPWTGVTNGGTVGGNSRYIQYRMALATPDPSSAPVVRDVTISCNVGADTHPPVISGLVATPDPAGVQATVAWVTDEAATSRVDFGTSPGSLARSVTDPAFLLVHSPLLTGLSPGTTYYYQVTSADAAGNHATAPATPASFTTPLQACFVDRTVADFAAGTPDTATFVSDLGDGDVILKPALIEEFRGASLPPDWGTYAWISGGAATVAGGLLRADGARANPDPYALTPGDSHRVVSVEFLATLSGDPLQHVGLGAGDNTTVFNTYPWAIFSTGPGGGVVMARTNAAGTSVDVAIPGPGNEPSSYWLGAPHRFRIDWSTTSVDYFIDGVLRHSEPVAVPGPMRPAASDYAPGGGVVSVDWLRVMPFPAAGAFVSRIYDGGGISTWGNLSWSADLPAGTSLGMSVRHGTSPVPDGTWTAFSPVAASGDPVGGSSRYVQYRADLATTDSLATPVLHDVSLTCAPCTSPAPAAIADLSAAATGNAGGGRAFVRVSWTGVPAGQTVSVYRRDYGDYPLYRADHGGAPAVPANPDAARAAGWTSTAIQASGGLDAPPARGFWYYVAFVSNDCNVASGPSNLSAGTLDYVLGDISDGNQVCAAGGEAGDAIVSTPDLSALGSAYGQVLNSSDSRVCFDVGPTVDNGIRSRPAPDGRIDFEDLVIYALNFEVPLPAVPARARPAAIAASRPAALPAPAGLDRDELTLVAPSSVSAGERFDVVLRLRGTGAVHALSTRLAWDASVAEFAGAGAGPMLTAAGGVVLMPRAGTVDAAVLGRAAPGIGGEGDLVIASFRALRDGDPLVRVADARARDAGNRAVALGAAGSPAATAIRPTQLGAIFPNPFQGALNVSFSLARDARVRLVVYDLAGRAVRKIEDDVRPAGLHVATWDGRGDAGSAAPPGFYIVRFESGEVRQNRRVQLIR